MAGYTGQYNTRLITMTVGIPAGVGGINVPIPGLPQGFQFPLIITGRATDNFYTVTNAADMVSTAVGTEGLVTHVINADESGNVSVTLKQGGLAVRTLGILFRAQRLIGEGQLPPFTFPVGIRDNNCTPPETHDALNCMILRQPDVTFGAGEPEITVGFVAAQVISNWSSRLAPG